MPTKGPHPSACSCVPCRVARAKVETAAEFPRASAGHVAGCRCLDCRKLRLGDA